ncbi:MAG: hypothetical protein ACLQO1_02175 [Steroidobacteraceae bacterium]
MLDLDALNERSIGKFPGFLGVVLTYLDGPEIGAELCIRDEFMAPNGFLHAGTIVTLHRGRTTQVWDALVTHKETNKTLALFRCTQMILYAK